MVLGVISASGICTEVRSVKKRKFAIGSTETLGEYPMKRDLLLKTVRNVNP